MPTPHKYHKVVKQALQTWKCRMPIQQVIKRACMLAEEAGTFDELLAPTPKKKTTLIVIDKKKKKQDEDDKKQDDGEA